MWRKGNPSTLLVGMQTGAATVQSSIEIPQKIRNVSVCLSTQLCHFWEYIEGTQNTNSKEHKHPYVHCSIIYNRPEMEAVQVSISR